MVSDLETFRAGTSADTVPTTTAKTRMPVSTGHGTWKPQNCVADPFEVAAMTAAAAPIPVATPTTPPAAPSTVPCMTIVRRRSFPSAPTLAAMFRAQARAVEDIERDPTPYVQYLIAETGGRLEAKDFQAWRLLHAPPQPYTRERFDDTYDWTVKWNMTVPGATFENTVDNRAWT